MLPTNGQISCRLSAEIPYWLFSNLNLCSGKQSLNIHDNVDNNVEYDIKPQTEDGSDNAYLSENNLVNDSNCISL